MKWPTYHGLTETYRAYRNVCSFTSWRFFYSQLNSQFNSQNHGCYVVIQILCKRLTQAVYNIGILGFGWFSGQKQERSIVCVVYVPYIGYIPHPPPWDVNKRWRSWCRHNVCCIRIVWRRWLTIDIRGKHKSCDITILPHKHARQTLHHVLHVYYRYCRLLGFFML